MEWVEVNGAGWSWVNGLAIPKTKLPTQSKTENFKEYDINTQK